MAACADCTCEDHEHVDGKGPCMACGTCMGFVEDALQVGGGWEPTWRGEVEA